MGELQHGTLFFGPRGRSRYKGGLSQCRAEGQGDVIPDRADDYVLQVPWGFARRVVWCGVFPLACVLLCRQLQAPFAPVRFLTLAPGVRVLVMAPPHPSSTPATGTMG